MKLVVGLGNPGPRYVRMRHNIGFRIVDALARRHDVSQWRTRFEARFSRSVQLDAVLALPQTFMNASGDAVRPLMAAYKIALPDVLVVCDDIALPFAHLRMRRGGSSGGHNGLKSIIGALGTDEFPRLRVGVGRHSADAISVVLGAFWPEEEKALPEVIERAAGDVETFLRMGSDAAIARVNADGGAPKAEDGGDDRRT
ncbi:MAG: aminoacyl-tRNA hydrolase [Candidatus Eremiobacteraeota bacterium]|nr:aminoacyl-tRNA hydrolase [Candidatus Eremiobacteraeota bacterium]MBC5827291.1 aminoacyl-tRNA hydrolase [Candidatus Eremiobacteraeota bacterium]